jgi:hypothetical protein
MVPATQIRQARGARRARGVARRARTISGRTLAPRGIPAAAAPSAEDLDRPDFSGWAVYERLFLRTPIRFLRACNTVLDLLFYDVGTLPPRERRRLLEWTDPDGSIVVVHPGRRGHRAVQHMRVDDFLRAPDLRDYGVVAIAGVGSSALGTAALAANVADALDRPVVGIVSGYGVADVLAEGLAGWFVLRPHNRLRQFLDGFLAPLTPLLAKISADTQPNRDPFRLVSYVRGFPEADALKGLLRLTQSRIGVAVGHSKGNFTLATVLDELARQAPAPLAGLEVVTLGALVALPRRLKTTRQFLGAFDSFGYLNSVLPQFCATVPWATHTLNPRMPFPLSATTAVGTSGVQGSTEGAWPVESLPGKLVDACFAPARFAADWLEIASGAFAAFGGAVHDSLRSLRDGAAQAARGARRGAKA